MSSEQPFLFQGQFSNFPATNNPTSLQELHSLIQSHAINRVTHNAKSLITLYHGSMVYSAKMRALVWDIETRLAASGVSSSAIHPSLSSPLCPCGFIAPGVVYGDLTTLEHAVRLISHPAAWTVLHNQQLEEILGHPPPIARKKQLWDSLATSTSVTMRPTLILSLSRVIPIEARLAYVTLRHSAYAAPDVDCLGAMISRIISKMMTIELGPKYQTRVAKSLRHMAPTLEPFSLYVLRSCRKGLEWPVGQRPAIRAKLQASLTAFFEKHGDMALYSPSLWATWLLEQEESFLIAFYVKYLYDGFQ